jgi:hypothetical protein
MSSDSSRRRGAYGGATLEADEIAVERGGQDVRCRASDNDNRRFCDHDGSRIDLCHLNEQTRKQKCQA